MLTLNLIDRWYDCIYQVLSVRNPEFTIIRFSIIHRTNLWPLRQTSRGSNHLPLLSVNYKTNLTLYKIRNVKALFQKFTEPLKTPDRPKELKQIWDESS